MSAKPNSQDQALSTLLQAYDVPPGSYDELRTPDGRMRTHWRTFVDALTALPPRERLARASRLDRQVRETGLVHDIFADPDTENSQWQLNLTPLIISAGEWRWLEQALCQRARLFNAILADIYGPQNLLRSGSIPPAFVFSDPAYLRNCQGIAPPGGHLQFYAMPTWHAAPMVNGASSTATPRHPPASAMQSPTASCRPTSPTISSPPATPAAWRRTSTRLHAALVARIGAKSPNIVLLTPGPSHDDYFSHAYIARYLGMHLVEGGDLRVVGDELFLKTLEGLKPVDSIVRCIEGAKADPLELDPDAFDGPVGLLNACRKIAEPHDQRAGLGRHREPRPWRLSVRSCASTCSVRISAVGRAALVARRRHRARPCREPARQHDHPTRSRRHRPPRPRHARPLDHGHVERRARYAQAGHGDARPSPGGRAADRFQHHADLDGAGPQAATDRASSFRQRHAGWLQRPAGRRRHGGRSRMQPWPSAPRAATRTMSGCCAMRPRSPLSAYGSRNSRPRGSTAPNAHCRAASPTICSGSAATSNGQTGPCGSRAAGSAIGGWNISDQAPTGPSAEICLQLLLQKGQKPTDKSNACAACPRRHQGATARPRAHVRPPRCL